MMAWLRAIFFENLTLKLVAVGLAVVLHMVVLRDRVKEFETDVPLGVRNLDEQQIFVGDLPDRLRLRVRGRWSDIGPLLGERRRPIYVDVAGRASGERFLFEPNTVAASIAPKGVEVISVDPPWVEIALEPKDARSVPVEISLVGVAARGFHVDRDHMAVTPAEVEIQGPRTAVLAIDRLSTAPIEIEGLDRSLRLEIPLARPEARHVALSVDRVRVELRVVEDAVSGEVPNVEVVVRNCPQGMKCTTDPDHVALKVSGPKRRVDAFVKRPPPGLVIAEVQQDAARAGRPVRLLIKQAEALSLASEPAEVTVRVEKLAEPP